MVHNRILLKKVDWAVDGSSVGRVRTVEGLYGTLYSTLWK